jgi:hypothetical protein
VPERLNRRTGVLRVLFQQTDEKLVLCLAQKSNDGLVSRIVYVYVKLTEQHLLLVLDIVVLPVLLGLTLLENILLTHRWHLWTLTFPFGLHVYDTTHI